MKRGYSNHFLSTVSFCKTTWRWPGLAPSLDLSHFALVTTKVINDTFLWRLLLFCRLVICLVPSFEMIGEIRCAAAVLDLRFFLLSRQSLQCTKLLSISSPETRHLKQLQAELFTLSRTALASRQLSLMLPAPMFHKNCLKFGTLNLKKVKVDGFKLSRNVLKMKTELKRRQSFCPFI